MRSLGVVVLDEAVELALEQLLGGGGLLFGEELLEGLVEHSTLPRVWGW